MSDLSFDRHQFDGRRPLPVSTASRIAFEDYTRMSVHTRKPALKRSTPAFALNDEMLAAVIRRRWELRRRAYLKPGTDETIKHKKAVRRAGSYMAMIAAIAYRSWRLGKDSIEVAREAGIRPACVRQHLNRMRVAARQLGYEPGPVPGKCGRPRKQQDLPNILRG
jgi:hypothetical protein